MARADIQKEGFSPCSDPSYLRDPHPVGLAWLHPGVLLPFLSPPMSWLNCLKAVASPQSISRYNRLGARFGIPLADPLLWRPSRKTVAGAAALGACLSFWVPVAQIPLALVLSGWLRWNLPAAAVGTLVNTPLTFAPVYWLASQIGESIWPGRGAAGVSRGVLRLGLAARALARRPCEQRLVRPVQRNRQRQRVAPLALGLREVLLARPALPERLGLGF